MRAILDRSVAETGDLAALAAGRFLAWHGLRPFTREGLPACLRPAGQPGYQEFAEGPLAFERFRFETDSGRSEVWLFWDHAGRVCLAEVFRLAARADASLFEALGPPDLVAPVPTAAVLQRPAHLPGGPLSERVYATRGLALAVRVGAEAHGSLVRVRGFEPMPARRYGERFVNLPQTRFFEA